MSHSNYLEDGAYYIDDDCDGDCGNCEIKNECEDCEVVYHEN